MKQQRTKEERKTYKEDYNDNNNMFPGNPQGLPDESNSENHKTYKGREANSNSNLRIVSISPGDLCGRRMLIFFKFVSREFKMTKDVTQKDEITEFLLYNSPNGEVKVEVFLHNENVWLTQKRMAELFDVQIPTINEHLKNIFSSGELDENSVIRKFLTTASNRKKIKSDFDELSKKLSKVQIKQII